MEPEISSCLSNNTHEDTYSAPQQREAAGKKRLGLGHSSNLAASQRVTAASAKHLEYKKRSDSDMSLPRTLGELQLFCLLQRANLTAYYQNFIQQGGDDVRQLCEAGEEEFLEIMVLVGMASKPLHVRRLQKALREWMANPAAFHRPLASSLSRFKLSASSTRKPKRKALDGGSADAFPEGKRLRSLVPAPTGSDSPSSSSDGEGRSIPALGSEEEEEEQEGRSGEAPGHLRLTKPVGTEGSDPVKKEERLEHGSERAANAADWKLMSAPST